MSGSSLVLSNISKSFAGIPALENVSLEVRTGEIHALLGENGAGKSTLMNIASGALQPDSGTIKISGEPIQSLNPHQATELGLAIVHQHPAVLPDLSIEENIKISVPQKFLETHGSPEATMRKMLDDFGFTVNIKDRVENLTIAQQHLLDLAKAFAVNPKVLILDEPTAPLGQESVEILFDRIKKIAASGTSVVYITHRLAEVRELSDRVTVLRDGRWRGVKEITEISDDEIMTMIVGRELESTFPPKHGGQTSDKQFFKVENISGADFQNVSLTANKGEIVGIAGVVGNGQSQLLRAIAGLDKYSGTIEINGDPTSGKQLLNKAAYMPSDRHGEGLMMSLSVRENAAVNALNKLTSGIFVSRKKETNTVLASLQSIDVKAPSMDADVSALSGGNQQKIVMSRSLLSEPILIIADEPTQGARCPRRPNAPASIPPPTAGDSGAACPRCKAGSP
ncbi:MAG: sugar ABC transporter ATP-binding protein, partial [Actinobacteria bacterium]|nr:sugar ABC transporter ATP-binding protein [Actinomycetota bacterium]